MNTAPAPWPDALAGTPAVTVIERAIARQRLGNSLLLYGDNLGTLATVAHGIADRLLNDPRHQTQYFPPKQHPDFFALRPAGKSRQITAETTRELIGRIQVTPQLSHRKVAVIYEADRMNAAASRADAAQGLEEWVVGLTAILDRTASGTRLSAADALALADAGDLEVLMPVAAALRAI